MLQRRKTMTDSAQPFAAKKFLEIKGRRMAYIDEGEGAPIVFAHGNPTSSYVWRNVMPACRGLGRLIACDMIGMGDSEKLPDSGPDRYTYAEQRNFLFALWKKLGVEPRRVSRRLQTLRGWGHAETNEVFPGSAITRRADGRRARGRARVAVGGDHLDRREDRLYRRDAPEVGAPSRA